MAKLDLREDIAAAWDLVEVKFGSKAAVRELEGQLNATERVERLTSGAYGGGTSLAVVTNERFLFLRADFMKSKVEVFRYEDITHVAFSTGTLGGLSITTVGTKATMRSMRPAEGRDVAELVQHHIEARRARSLPPVPPPAARHGMSTGEDPSARLLGYLAELHAAGVLTAVELRDKSALVLGNAR